jgi:hypothetical protein
MMTDRYTQLIERLLEAKGVKADLEFYKEALEKLYLAVEEELNRVKRKREEFEKTIEREIQEGRASDRKIERLEYLKSLENEVNLALIKLRTFIDLLKETITDLDLVAREIILSLNPDEVDRLVTRAIQKISEEIKKEIYEKVQYWDTKETLERIVDEGRRINWIIEQGVEYLKKKNRLLIFFFFYFLK